MAGTPYPYVGPSDLWVDRRGDDVCVVTTSAVLDEWLAGRNHRDRAEPFTFVIDLHGDLRLAPRRSEHVACAEGRAVLSAGEMTFRHGPHGWYVTEVSNQSTGYCPAPDSWPAVAAALDRIGIGHPDDFTNEVILRVCATCGERNIVRDDHYVCALCEADLAPDLAGPDAQATAIEVQQLLDELCIGLGFCLPKPDQERLRRGPFLDTDASLRRCSPPKAWIRDSTRICTDK